MPDFLMASMRRMMVSLISRGQTLHRSCSQLPWRGTHSLAPLSYRTGTYSGVFTLFPLLTGLQRANHGHILREVSKLAEQHQLKPLLTEQTFGRNEIAAAYDLVEKGSQGKVVVEH